MCVYMDCSLFISKKGNYAYEWSQTIFPNVDIEILYCRETYTDLHAGAYWHILVV